MVSDLVERANEPVAWRYRHPDGEGGWHAWILTAQMPVKRYEGSEYEPLYTLEKDHG